MPQLTDFSSGRQMCYDGISTRAYSTFSRDETRDKYAS